MASKNLITVTIIIILLSGCSIQNYRPIVDYSGVDMNNYEKDLAECKQYALQIDPAAQGLGGTAIGAGLGAALGAIVGSSSGQAGEGASINNISVSGDAADNVISGNAEGNDTLAGGTGNDARMLGGQGQDKLYGEAGSDFLNGNKDNDMVVGGTGSDTVHGGQDDDLIYGESGNDFLYGDLGNDTITGGTGADIFVFRANSGIDIITDFITGTDILQIHSSIFATTTQAVAAFSAGILDLGNGNTVALTGLVNLAESDFVIG